MPSKPWRVQPRPITANKASIKTDSFVDDKITRTRQEENKAETQETGGGGGGGGGG